MASVGWKRASVALAAAIGVAVSAAQSPSPQVPTFRTGANYVRVDVYPTVDGRIVPDLRQDEFQVFEDGVRQTVDAFQHIVVEPPGPQATRVEPNSVRDSRQMAADPKSRLFVIFLDTYHLTWESGYWARGPFVNLLNRAIGQDDLVGVMTPEMSASAVTFARRTETIEEILGRYFDTGRKDVKVGLDRIENQWMACYGDGWPATEMIARRREKLTLDAMEELSVHLAGIREERKAIFAISEGWELYRPNAALAKPLDGRAPSPPRVGVGPDGRLRAGNEDRSSYGENMSSCDQDRVMLAQEDHETQYRHMLDVANRSNASFYAVDPRGLVAESKPTRALRRLQESLRSLSSATDGVAVMDTNDLDRGLQRVVDDLTSYYLLGYYSSNAAADGRFRSITVKVTRPGVRVRARRGYVAEAASPANAAKPAAGPAPSAVPPPALTGALAELTRIPRVAAVRSRAGFEWGAGGGLPRAGLWVAGEFDVIVATREERWQEGAGVVVKVTKADGSVVSEQRPGLTDTARSALLHVAPEGGLPPGEYVVAVTATPVGATVGQTETLKVRVPAPPGDGAPAVGQPMLFRKGPFSGADFVPVGDLRFHRQERAKSEVSVAGAPASITVRLLDRAGNPLKLPVSMGERQEGGVLFVSGEVALAPLGFGDYLIETTIATARTTEIVLAAFRIVP